jgi:hypothetical protein
MRDTSRAQTVRARPRLRFFPGVHERAIRRLNAGLLRDDDGLGTFIANMVEDGLRFNDLIDSGRLRVPQTSDTVQQQVSGSDEEPPPVPAVEPEGGDLLQGSAKEVLSSFLK